MRERIFDDIASIRIQPTDNVLFVRGIPDHVIAVDADGVGAGVRSGKLKFLEGFGFGIEMADLAPDSLGEPNDAVSVEFQALRFALRRGIKLGQLPVLGDPDDGAVVVEDCEPLVAILSDNVAVSPRRVVMATIPW